MAMSTEEREVAPGILSPFVSGRNHFSAIKEELFVCRLPTNRSLPTNISCWKMSHFNQTSVSRGLMDVF